MKHGDIIQANPMQTQSQQQEISLEKLQQRQLFIEEKFIFQSMNQQNQFVSQEQRMFVLMMMNAVIQIHFTLILLQPRVAAIKLEVVFYLNQLSTVEACLQTLLDQRSRKIHLSKYLQVKNNLELLEILGVRIFRYML